MFSKLRYPFPHPQALSTPTDTYPPVIATVPSLQSMRLPPTMTLRQKRIESAPSFNLPTWLPATSWQSSTNYGVQLVGRSRKKRLDEETYPMVVAPAFKFERSKLEYVVPSGRRGRSKPIWTSVRSTTYVLHDSVLSIAFL